MALLLLLISPCNSSSLSFNSSSTPPSLKPPPPKLLRFHLHTTPVLCKIDNDENANPNYSQDSVGVRAALSVLRFYKREISPLLPRSCRYVPTCSEYSMIAYTKYGFAKGSVLTAWRICRCNPLGGSGFDPPRWFDEETPPNSN